MNPHINALTAQHTEVKEAIDEYMVRANGTLTTDEETEVDELYVRAGELKAKIEKAIQNAQNITPAVIPASHTITGSPTPFDLHYPNKLDKDKISDALFTFVRAGMGNPQAQIKIRALAEVESTDSAGSLPFTIQSGIIRFVDSRRRVIDSLTHFALPAGASFRKIVESGDAAVAEQVDEFDEIVSSTGSLSFVEVGNKRYAGGIRISLDALEVPEPNAEELWTKLVFERYAKVTDIAVAVAMKAAASTTATLASSSTPAQVIAAVFAAAETVETNSKKEANAIWITPGIRTWLATLTYDSGEPAFPILGPTNRDGTVGSASTYSGINIAGLPVVVAPNFAGGTFVVGNGSFGEVYESMSPTLTAWDVSHLAKEIGISGRLGTYFRPEGFVRLVDNAATPVFV